MSLADVLAEYTQASRKPGPVNHAATARAADAITGWTKDPDSYPGDRAARKTLYLCEEGLGHWVWPSCRYGGIDSCEVVALEL